MEIQKLEKISGINGTLLGVFFTARGVFFYLSSQLLYHAPFTI